MPFAFSAGAAKPWGSWNCFHTSMYALKVEETYCGTAPRTIGAPFAALIAEQLKSSGAQVIRQYHPQTKWSRRSHHALNL